MIYTWVADVSRMKEEDCLQSYYGKLIRDPEFGAGRQLKADRQKTGQGKRQSIGAGILLMEMRRYYGLPEGFLYNLSHSGEYALCSVETAKGEGAALHLGCDIETVKDYRQAVARRFFTKGEYETLENTPEGKERTELFYRYWVLKESFMKATGLGMRLAMSAFEIDPGECPVLIRKPGQICGQYYYRTYEAAEIEAKIAVCADVEAFAEEIRYRQL